MAHLPAKRRPGFQPKQPLPDLPISIISVNRSTFGQKVALTFDPACTIKGAYDNAFRVLAPKDDKKSTVPACQSLPPTPPDTNTLVLYNLWLLFCQTLPPQAERSSH